MKPSRLITILPTVLLAALCLCSCDKRDIHKVVKDMAEAPVDTTGFSTTWVHTNVFSAVEIDCFADVTFHQTGEAGTYLRLRADKEVLEHISTRTNEDVLLVATDRRYRMPEKAIIVIDIYAPYANKFTLNGGKCLRLGKLTSSSPVALETYGNIGAITSDSISAPEISIPHEGDGSVDLRGIDAHRLTTGIKGDGHVYLSGRADMVKNDISGGGGIDTGKLRKNGQTD